MRSCVAQGFVIGPLLFLLFENDLPEALEAVTLFYADDVKNGNSSDTEHEPAQLSYCPMGVVTEMGPTDQSC